VKTPTTFTKSVSLPKRDPSTAAVIFGPDSKPLIDAQLGSFAFKCPTLLDEVTISSRFAELTRGQPREAMLPRALDIAAMLAELPMVVTKTPDDWNWDNLEGDEDFYKLVAVWFAYQEGRQEISGIKVNAAAPPPVAAVVKERVAPAA
jgi:hypothetical protein